MSQASWITILATGFATAVFFVVIYFLYRLVRRGIALLLKGVDLEVPPIALLVSFALAATIFSTGATNLWGLFYGLIQVLFVDFPRAIVEMTSASYSCGESLSRDDFFPVSDCFFKIGGTIADSIQKLFARSLTYLTHVISLVQFFAAWALLAWCLGDLLNRTESTGASKGLRRLINDMSSTARLRFGLGSVIAIAAYFCFCAIVAVSLFKPVEKPQVLDHKILEERLNQAKLTDGGQNSAFSLRFPETLGELIKNPSPTVDDQKISATYHELTESWKQLRQQVLGEQERLVQRAVAAYTIENLNRVGSREQANHFLKLGRWVDRALSGLFANLDNCRSAISRVRGLVISVSSGRQTPLVNDPGPPILRTDSPTKRSNFSEQAPAGVGGVPMVQSVPPWLDASAAANVALQHCQARLDISEPPDRSDFGLTLGIVGDLSIWLLRTESMPLALITGLIGFGLFGALISTFVRTPAGQTPQLDIFGVVTRGVSAALVVFLAAYGGIAIVSQTGSDPNPYVVFVTCLVGAVFGDNVWLWAKDRFLPKSGAPAGPSSKPKSGASATEAPAPG